MAEYKTPGVYVEEISTFPTSVVRVTTAVPVFIGYTELDPVTYQNKPTKVRSLVEYERIYGGEPPSGFGRELVVELDPVNNYDIVSTSVNLKYYLYQSLRFFYANGGGDAYIISVGTYTEDLFADVWPDVALLNGALAELEKVDEITLLVSPDAWALELATDLGDHQKQMLMHCNKMQDRFAILDIQHDSGGNGQDDDSSAFRDNVGIQNLKYGAAYYPELLSSLGPNGTIGLDSFVINPGAMTISALGTAIADAAIIGYTAAGVDAGNVPDDAAYLAFQTAFDALVPTPSNSAATLKDRMDAVKQIVDLIYGYQYTPTLTNVAVLDLVSRIAEGDGSPLQVLVQKMIDYDLGFTGVTAAIGSVVVGDYPDYTLSTPAGVPLIYGAGPGYVEATAAALGSDDYDLLFDEAYGYLGEIRDLVNTIATGDDLFTTSRKLAEIRDALRTTGYTMPPSGAIAGIYAVNDANNGVWHAPANMSLNSVSEVARKMQLTELDDLNIPNAGNGKSINAIRFFRGQGILVYGARTLAGNDNEWRYVSVRRLFIMVEESVKKATEPFVFEPNDANTWIKVKGMIENFLLGLWRDGALAGAVPKDAFFVKCGIGQTMTADDILNGKLIVEIGMAAVRPAEFVILKFMHKMQES